MGNQQTRLSVFINDNVKQFILNYRSRHGVSATESTRRAYNALMVFEEADRNGQIVQVCRRDGRPLYEARLF